jgi:hypothetical protein
MMIAGAGLIFGFILLTVIYAIVLGGFNTAFTDNTTVQWNVIQYGLLFFNNTVKQFGTTGTIFGLIPLAGIALLFVGGYGLVAGAGRKR